MTNEAAISASEPPMTSPTKTTPQEKLLKLNANGKLLSSPSIVSPVMKSRGKKGDEKHDDLQRPSRIALKYGTDQEGRVRIGMKINELMSRTSSAQKARLTLNDVPSKATHPFFLGKHAQTLEPTACARLSDALGKDHVSEVENQPSSLRTAVAWKDIVFASQKPTFMKTADTTGAPWPPIEIQHLGAEVKESPRSHILRLRGSASSKSKEQHTQITTEEDIVHCKSDMIIHLIHCLNLL